MEIIVDSQDTLKHLNKIMWYMDEPIADSAVLPSYLLSKFASKHVKVILNGLGGDELFGGYRSDIALKNQNLENFVSFLLKKFVLQFFLHFLG